jgi:hypothetical protein
MQKNKGFVGVPVVAGLVLLVAVVGYLGLSRWNSSPMVISRVDPETPSVVAGLTGKTPNTVTPSNPVRKPTYPPETNPTSIPSGVVTEPVASPINKNTGLSAYPDLELSTGFIEPVSVKFLVDHRSALNGKTITVRGVVVSTLLGEKACPPDRGMCAQSSVFLADTMSSSRDKAYDLKILVKEGEMESNYPIGTTVNIRISVVGDTLSVIASKVN